MVKKNYGTHCGRMSSRTQGRTHESSRESASEPRGKVVSGKRSIYTHFPKDRNCDVCKKTKTTRAPCRKRTGTAMLQAENVGVLITAITKFLLKDVNLETIIDTLSWYKIFAAQWIQAYPCKTKTSQETEKSLQKVLGAE